MRVTQSAEDAPRVPRWTGGEDYTMEAGMCRVKVFNMSQFVASL